MMRLIGRSVDYIVGVVIRLLVLVVCCSVIYLLLSDYRYL